MKWIHTELTAGVIRLIPKWCCIWFSAILIVTSPQICAAQTVINLSRDLVSLGIASKNMTPDQPDLDSAPLFRAAVNYARERNASRITADRGSYYFLSVDTGGSYHVLMNNIRNLTIDLSGSELLFKENLRGGFGIFSCSNVAIQNFTADYISPPSTQVEVTAVDPATRTISYRVPAGWASPQQFNAADAPLGVPEDVGVFFFRGKDRVLGVGTWFHATRPFAPTSFQVIETDYTNALSRVLPGDTALIVLRGGVGGPLFSSQCADLNINNVRIYSAGTIGVVDAAGTRNTFERIYVMPRPGSGRLISTNADGISLLDPHEGNVVRLSRIIASGDDGISPHAVLFGYVAGHPSPRILEVPRLAFEPLPNGSGLVLQDADTGQVITTAAIVAQTPAAEANPPSGTLTTLTLDRDIGALPRRVAVYTTDPKRRGDGLVIERNLVQDLVVARGMTLWGLVNATARGNYLKRIPYAGIAMYHRLRDCNFCDFEGPPLANVRVQRNVIDQSNLFFGAGGSDEDAGILIDSLITDGAMGARPMTQARPNTGIVIENNYIADPQRSAVRVSTATGGAVRANVFVRPNNDPKHDGYWGYVPDTVEPNRTDFRQPVVVKFSSQMDVAANQVERSTVPAQVTNGDGSEPIAVSPGASVLFRPISPLSIAAGATATLTDADGTAWPIAIGASGSTGISMSIPAGAALGGAYISVFSSSVIARGTLFIDTDLTAEPAEARPRTFLALAISGTQLTGRLSDARGNAVAAAVVDVKQEQLSGDGALATYTITGTVPAGTPNGIFQLCANCDSVGVGGDVDLYSVTYADTGGTTTLDFSAGLATWGGTVPTPQLRSEQGNSFAHFTLSSAQGFFNSRTFALVPGSAYTFTVRARVSPQAVGGSYFALLFGTPEVSRQRIRFSATASLGAVQTAADGGFAVPLPTSGGASEVIATFAGDQTHAGQQARAPVPYTSASAVFSSAQPTSQSFIRLHNTSQADGTALVTIRNAASGQLLAQWTSPNIPAGAEQQFAIATIEAATGITNRPQYYGVAIQPSFRGYFQHVLFRAADGTLTNLSTCESGVTSDEAVLSGVHSSLLDNGYPSSVVINNNGATAAAATVGIYDARNGERLGTYVTPLIAGKAQHIVAIEAVESALRLTPSPGMFHYVLKIDGGFPGFLQHLVNNQRAGVITDMTTACSVTPTEIGRTLLSSTATLGAVFSTAQTASQSFIRLINTGTAAGAATVTLRDASSAQQLGQWTSPTIPPNSEQQFQIGTLEIALSAGAPKPAYYTINLESAFSGYLQHVLYRPSDGTLTNLSTCAAGVFAEPTILAGVHSSLLSTLGFPSSVVVSNTGMSAEVVTLGVYDARNGNKLGRYVTPTVPAEGEIVLSMDAIATAAGITPGQGMFHYVLKTEGSFVGFLQNLVDNTKVGVVTDMTTACAVTPSSSL